MPGRTGMPPIPGQTAASDQGGPGPGRTKAKRIVVSKYTRHACNQCKKAYVSYSLNPSFLY